MIFSVFVMHFKQSEEWLRTLAKKTQPGGYLIFNIYNINEQKLVEALNRAGWVVVQNVICGSIPWNHRIYICKKVPS